MVMRRSSCLPICAGVLAVLTLHAGGGNPASMTSNPGTTPQSAPVNGAFAMNLAATVKDASSVGVSGVTVTFTLNPAPTGASGTFSGSSAVVTDASGVATAPLLTANGIAGKFTVTASTG